MSHLLSCSHSCLFCAAQPQIYEGAASDDDVVIPTSFIYADAKTRLLLLAQVFRTCKQFAPDVSSAPRGPTRAAIRADERAEARRENAAVDDALFAEDRTKRLKMLTGEAVLAKHNLDVRNQRYKEVETHLAMLEKYRPFIPPPEYAKRVRLTLNKLPDPADITGEVEYRPAVPAVDQFDVPAPVAGGVGVGDALVEYPDEDEELGDEDEHVFPELGAGAESGGDDTEDGEDN